MKIRIHDNQSLDLDTISEMLLMADEQANFNPQNYWILDIVAGESENFNLDEKELNKKYIDLFIKWIGRDAVVSWLTSNQVSFEVISYDHLGREKTLLQELHSELATETKSNIHESRLKL